MAMMISDAAIQAQSPGRYSGLSCVLQSVISEASWITTLTIPEDKRPSDTSDPAKSHKRCAAESPLPLTTDVVTLIAHGLWDVGIGTSTGQEHAEVAHAEGVYPAHECKTDDAEGGVNDQEWAADVVLDESQRRGRSAQDRLTLSPSHPVIHITIPAKAYGGATKHCAAPTSKPIPSLRMIGKK